MKSVLSLLLLLVAAPPTGAALALGAVKTITSAVNLDIMNQGLVPAVISEFMPLLADFLNEELTREQEVL